MSWRFWFIDKRCQQWNNANEPKHTGRFLGMLLGTLATSLLGSDGVIRAGQDF